MMQTTLFSENDIQAKFEKFDRENPMVYSKFRSLALKGINAGRKKLGAKQIVEIIRWDMYFETLNEEYKINNNYTSRYARKFAKEFPEYADRFNFRSLKSA